MPQWTLLLNKTHGLLFERSDIMVGGPSLWVSFHTQGVHTLCESCPRASDMSGTVRPPLNDCLICGQFQQQVTIQVELLISRLKDKYKKSHVIPAQKLKLWISTHWKHFIVWQAWQQYLSGKTGNPISQTIQGWLNVQRQRWRIARMYLWLYAFPPISLLWITLQYVQHTMQQILLITPVWFCLLMIRPPDLPSDQTRPVSDEWITVARQTTQNEIGTDLRILCLQGVWHTLVILHAPSIYDSCIQASGKLFNYSSSYSTL